jgi:Uma2 family endonuclease
VETKRSRIRWTWSEFARLPDQGSRRAEVIDDELYVTPAPTPWHQRVVTRLIETLGPFVRKHDLGEVFPGPIDVIFAEGDYLEPDLVFVGRDRLGLVSDRGIEGPPDLVVEVLSPSTAGRDRGLKRDRYRLYGVAEYWILDPDSGAVEAWAFDGDTETARSLGRGDTFRWTPVAGGPAVDISASELVGPRHPSS